jgi:hypothetical protein
MEIFYPGEVKKTEAQIFKSGQYTFQTEVPLIETGTFNDTEFSQFSNIYGYKQECTNPHRQVAREIKYTTVAPIVYESSE